MYEFPRNHRNFVRFNAQGRLICTAGFGNLAGDMDFFDRQTFKNVSTVHAPNSSVAEWSPCGRYILTATCTPRLRVDNGYRIWHYTGVVVGRQEVSELYTVSWRPRPVETWPDRRALTPPPPTCKGQIGGGETTEGVEKKEDKPVAAKPAGRYVPPAARARGATSDIKTELPGLAGLEQRLQSGAGMPGSNGTRAVPGTAAYAQQNARKKPVQPYVPQGMIPVAHPVPVSGMPMAYMEMPDMDPERQKRLRTVQKKLREIEELKMRIATGHALELTQVWLVEGKLTFFRFAKWKEKVSFCKKCTTSFKVSAAWACRALKYI
jgi:translation initiation factor 2A